MPKPGQAAEAKPVGATTPRWSRITVRNVTATGVTKNAGVILGLPEAPATGLTLENLRIEAAAGLRLGYAKDVVLRRVTVTAADGKPWILEPTIEGLQRVD
jgi:hypothetical protein